MGLLLTFEYYIEFIINLWPLLYKFIGLNSVSIDMYS